MTEWNAKLEVVKKYNGSLWLQINVIISLPPL